MGAEISAPAFMSRTKFLFLSLHESNFDGKGISIYIY
jgi:hypothetical protein